MKINFEVKRWSGTCRTLKEIVAPFKTNHIFDEFSFQSKFKFTCYICKLLTFWMLRLGYGRRQSLWSLWPTQPRRARGTYWNDYMVSTSTSRCSFHPHISLSPRAFTMTSTHVWPFQGLGLTSPTGQRALFFFSPEWVNREVQLVPFSTGYSLL